MSTIQKQFRKYTDFSFSFTRNPLTNQVNIKSNAEAIKQSVRNILLTKKGEKPFDPNFGSPIAELLFENVSPVVSSIIRDEIKRVVEFYEKRITINDVTVSFKDTHTIKVDIIGIIINTSEPLTISTLISRLR